MTLRPRTSRWRRRLTASVVTVASLGCASVLSGCGASTPANSATTSVPVTSPSSSPSTPTSGPAASGPPAVPTNGAYLGAWLHPEPAGRGASFAVEQATLPSVVAATGRPLGLLHVYAPWARPVPVTALRAVAAAGSTPILDWACGPDVSQLASGVDDRLISSYAADLRDYGAPVLLRWCWEMNLVALHPQVGGGTAFVHAWNHVRTLFRRAGASNVAFVWCPGLTGVDPAPYYPGPAAVDWIGVDGYDRDGTQTFASLFTPFYRSWVAQGKPMIVGETGAAGAAQPGYIDSIGTDAPALPAIKAVAYFDAPGPLAPWQFTPAGLQAFARLSALPYFNSR